MSFRVVPGIGRGLNGYTSYLENVMRQLLGSLVCALLCAATSPGAEPDRDVASLAARPAPAWLTEGIIYQVWLRSFTPEGTLGAATKRLPGVAELGATIVYLPPVMLLDDDPRREFWSPRQKQSGTNNPKNPYRVKDYDRIDPEYGTEADLKEFVDTAHKLGLRVMIDLVYHHAGPTCVLLERPDFFLRDASGKPVTNHWNFLRLNFKSRPVREYFLANMLHWVKDFKVDGFRCDVSGASPLDFWEEARARLDPVRPDLVILAEDCRRPADQVKAFDVNYSFDWYRRCEEVLTLGKPASELRVLWEKRRDAFPRGARFIRYSDNHDLHRADVVFGSRGAQAVAVLNFTLDGVPMLYNGQEIGDATPQDLFACWPIRWEAAGLPRAVAKLAFFKRLCKVRRSEPALTAGEVVWLANDRPDSVVSFLRRTPSREILSVVNLSNRTVEVQVTFPDAIQRSYSPILADRAGIETAEGSASLELKGFGYLAGKRN